MINRATESDSDDSDKEYFKNLINKHNNNARQNTKQYNFNYKAAIAHNKRKIGTSSEEDYHPKKVLKKHTLQVRISLFNTPVHIII
jgi:hypothetical protein